MSLSKSSAFLGHDDAAMLAALWNVWDSIPARVALLDANGKIVAVNEAWRTALPATPRRAVVGCNYLDLCDEAVLGGGDRIAQQMAEAIGDVQRGVRDRALLEYLSDDEQRWFEVRINRCSKCDPTYLLIAHDDITERKQAAQRTERMEQTLREVLELLPLGVWILDEQGRVIHGNRVGQKMWAGTRYVEDLHGREYKGWWWLNTGTPEAPTEWAAMRALQGQATRNQELTIHCFDGKSRVVFNSAMPLRGVDGQQFGAMMLTEDITARRRAEAELLEAKLALEYVNGQLRHTLMREQAKARTDELTGIHNRRHFFALATHEFFVAQRYRRALSIAMLDLDHFKNVNDGLGHQAGDEVLKYVAQLAKEHLRSADVLGRYGGEEFIVMLPDSTAEQSLVLIDRIRTTLAGMAIDTGYGSVTVTFSVGVAQLKHDETLEQLIQRADEALYEAKVTGRNRTIIANPTRD